MKKIGLKLSIWIGGIVMVLVIAVIYPSIGHYLDNSEEKNIEAIEETVKSYLVLCYATEGSYPPDLEYLVDNYGLILLEDGYIYDYEVFASNIMPEIKVYEKN